MFLNDKKELYACGLNESNQLGIDKNMTARVVVQSDRASTTQMSQATGALLRGSWIVSRRCRC